MSSSLLFQQCPASLVHLTLIVFVIGGKWLYTVLWGRTCSNCSQHACVVTVKLFLHPFSQRPCSFTFLLLFNANNSV